MYFANVVIFSNHTFGIPLQSTRAHLHIAPWHYSVLFPSLVRDQLPLETRPNTHSIQFDSTYSSETKLPGTGKRP